MVSCLSQFNIGGIIFMTAKEAKCWIEVLINMIKLSPASTAAVSKKLLEALDIAHMAIDMNIERIEIEEDGGKS